MKHVETRFAERMRPHFVLELLFYHDINADTTACRPSYRLLVSLPGNMPARKALYCRSKTSPCLRGGTLPNTKARDGRTVDVGKNINKLQESWDVTALGRWPSLVRFDPLTAGSMQTYRASSTSVDVWNARCARGLEAPWTAVTGERAEADSCVQWDGKFAGEARRAALSSLRSFLREEQRPCKYLICPETTFGWDLEKLEETILRQLGGNTSTTLLGYSLTSIVNYFSQYGTVKASIKAQPPAVVVRSVNSSFYNHLRKYIDSPENHFILLSFTCAALAFLTFLAAKKGYVCPPLIAGILIGVFSTASTLSTLGALTFARQRCVIHETLGIAWALKYEEHVSKQNLSRAEVIASVPHAIDATANPAGGWDVIVGLDEQEYWRRNEDLVLAAIRRRHQGVLCPERNTDPSISSARSTSAPSGSNSRASTATYNFVAHGDEPPPQYF